MSENTAKKGYYTTTKRKRIYTNHIENLKLTQEIYNETILEYYNLLLEHLEYLKLSNQNCMRELEKLTIKSKTGEKPENYLELDVPVYLRRAAINQAIGYVRSYSTKLENYLKNEALPKEQKQKNISKPNKANHFNSPILFYKGMYRELTNESIEIKLFNGESWKWYPAKIKGLRITEDAEILSPTIIQNKEYIMIHIPVKEVIEDVTPVKERMKQEDIRVCGIAFSNSDSFAICVVLDKERNLLKTKFIKGGKEYKDRTTKILSKIRKHRQNSKPYTEKDHKRYWQKLNNISDFYAHKVSKEIIDFCLENEVKVISITDIDEDVSKHFGKRVGKYSPIYLRKRIVKYLNYKAYKNGIIITRIRSNYTASKCYRCRAEVKKNGLKYICENGHKGDYFFNSAMNISIMCLKKFGK